jgi:poly(3-hydroxybutyrate) depolymerase
MAGLRTAAKPKAARPPVIIIAVGEMDTATFAIHFSKRHKGSLADLSELPPNMDFNVEQNYRAFHNRLHGLRRYKHEHELDSPEVSIDRALECLFENRNWGWKQLAGVDGLVAVFPDGKIAAKHNNRTKHFNEIDEATDYLLGNLPG